MTKGCRWCEVEKFDNWPQYARHLDSDLHKKVLKSVALTTRPVRGENVG